MRKRRHQVLIEAIQGDADGQNTSLLRAALQGNDHQVFEAANGRLGLELYRERSADLLITDFAMPEINGLDLISELTKSARVKIIAMTGDAKATTRLTRARLLGARQVLRKPFDLATLPLAEKRCR